MALGIGYTSIDAGEMPTDAPSQVGDYALVRLLAQGGMADLFLARTAEGAEAVIKVLSPRRAVDAESCALFHDEAKLLALFDHDNVPRVIAMASENGVPCLVMEYVAGADLREVAHAAMQANVEIPFEAAVAIVMGAAAGLDHAHRRCDANGRPLRLVHRDVSLSNIMLSHDGDVKVIDFGIAQSAQSTVHTAPGVVRGKASYMSPEQCMGERVDLRTDVFALGIVLYELTTGRRCFRGSTDFSRMLAVVRGEFIAPRATCSDYPIELEAIVIKALSIDPDERYASAAAMIEDLARVAAELGWQCDTRAIAALMFQLFPDAHVAVRAYELDGDDAPKTVVTHPRWFPSGTESEIRRRAPDEEDVRTRGRRSLPRMYAVRAA